MNESLINTQVVNNYSLVFCQTATRLLNLITGTDAEIKLFSNKIRLLLHLCNTWRLVMSRLWLLAARRWSPSLLGQILLLGVCANNLRIATKWKAFEMLGILMCSTSNDLTKLLLMHVDRYNDQTSSSQRGFSQRTTRTTVGQIYLFSLSSGTVIPVRFFVHNLCLANLRCRSLPLDGGCPRNGSFLFGKLWHFAYGFLL